MTAEQIAREAIPTGTFGARLKKSRGWTKAEQDRHYADLCEAIGAVNDRTTTHHRSTTAA